MTFSKTIIKEKGKEVEECQILGGIDTLYCFLDCTELASKELYQTLWHSVNNGSFQREHYHFLNFSGKKNGFVGGWYVYIGRGNIPLFRVGFKDPNKQKHVKNVYIQFEGSGIYSMGFYELLNFVRAEFSDLLGFDVTNSHLIPSRVDLNAFVNGYDFSDIDADMFRTRSVTSKAIKNECLEYDNIEELSSYEYRSRRGINTLYLGDKSSPLFMKIYDKLKEVNDKISDISSMIKRHFLTSNGFTSDHIWNIEFTIKSEVLKQYSINSLDVLLFSADSIFRDLMDRYSFLGYDLEKISSFRSNKNISKLQLHSIWKKVKDDYRFCNYDVDVQRVFKEYKKGSKNNSKQVIIREIKRQIEFDQPFTINEMRSLFLDAQRVS